MTRYDFSAQALEDLRAIGRYTRKEWGLDQARRYRQELEAAMQRLSRDPGLGRPREDIAPGLRSFRTAAHITFYLAGHDGIVIVRLLHPSMDVELAFLSEESRQRQR